MAKKKTSNKARRNGNAVVPRPVGMRLSDAGVRYARLLADPCTADLVNGPFGDGFGGMVSRFEREYVINNSATDVAAFFAFTPGLGTGIIANAPITDETATITPVALLASSNPGYAFLQPNASHIRPLAACVQVYWPGSELNRQGIISMGRHASEVVNDGASVSSLRAQANYIQRMPADKAEIVWRPTEFDLRGQEWAATPSAGTAAGMTSIVVTATGIPPSTGIRIRVVAVYEWMPDAASGFKNVVVRTPTPHRLADIIAFLDRTGDWMAGTAHSAGRALSSLAGGVASIMSLGNGANRLGRAMLAAA